MTQEKIIYSGIRGLNHELQKEQWSGAKYTILLDENTFQHCLPRLIDRVEALQQAEFLEVPTGEDCKDIGVVTQVWQTLLESGSDRNTVIVNLGGGAICDLGGFVASTYKRGIRHINIPTTLLAMTDASIGGKTAIDLGGIKNSVGTFYSPTITVLETGFLTTLPTEELKNGLMEMAKTAMVTSLELYSSIITSTDITPSMIKEVAKIKSRIVKADQFDHSIRHILNFGHTIGHAIEVYGTPDGNGARTPLPHGISVGLGMLSALYLSTQKTGLDKTVYHTYSSWLKQYTAIPHYNLHDIEAMLPLIHHDKKNGDGNTRCVLLQDIGVPMIDVDVNDNELRDTLLKLDS